MLDYKSIIRLKKLGLKTAAITNSLGCKWESLRAGSDPLIRK